MAHHRKQKGKRGQIKHASAKTLVRRFKLAGLKRLYKRVAGRSPPKGINSKLKIARLIIAKRNARKKY